MSFQPWAFDRLHYFFLLFTQHHRYGRHFIRSSQFKLHLMHKYYVMLLISYGPHKRIINNVLETAGIVHFFVLFILIIWNGDQEGRSVMQCWPKAVCFEHNLCMCTLMTVHSFGVFMHAQIVFFCFEYICKNQDFSTYTFVTLISRGVPHVRFNEAKGRSLI